MLFYSPNCNDDIQLPPPWFDLGTSHNPIIYFHENLSNTIHTPHWWTQMFGWMAFVPKQAHLEGALLGLLAHIPNHLDEVDGKYQLPTYVMDGWRNIECWLYSAITSLRGKFELPSFIPAGPSARGYRRAHASRSIALKEAQAARKIFVLWIGLLSNRKSGYKLCSGMAIFFSRKAAVPSVNY